MRMQKRQFRIGELAKHLGVERFVIRFWEKEFGLRTTRSDGGQRFYEERDLERLQIIKRLLYEEGFTISGAKKYMKEHDEHRVIASRKTTIEAAPAVPAADLEKLTEKLTVLKNQLLKLQELL